MLEHLQRIPVQRPLGHHDAAAGQQLPGPHHGQAVIDDHRLELAVMRGQQRPRRPVPVPAVRADPLGHRGQQLIAQLALA